MESQMVNPHGHGHDQQDPYKARDPHLAAEGEDHHEKKSVLEKVKAKAKKIRDTITKPGHGHDHDHDHITDDRDHITDDHDRDSDRITDDHDHHRDRDHITDDLDLDRDHITDDRDRDRDRDHITDDRDPITDDRDRDRDRDHITVDRDRDRDRDRDHITDDCDRDHITDDHDLDQDDDEDEELVEDPEVHGAPIYESTITPLNTPVPSFSDRGISETKETDPSKTLVPGTESKVNLERPRGLEEDPHSPKDTPYDYTPSNYQTKVTDPTGAGNEEIGVTPILSSFEKMKIHDESEPKSHQNITNIEYSSTGSHDQFSPETPDKPIITPQHPQTLQENMDTSKTEPSSLTERISYATSSIADKAISAKNVVVSKLGYGERDDRGVHESTTTGDNSGSKQSSAAGYGKKIAATVTEKLTPVYGKIAEKGTTVVSKRQGPKTTSGSEIESGNGTTGQDRGVSVKDYLAEKLRPGEEDRVLSEVISGALHKRKQEAETRPVGTVTESEEVARRLGTGDKKMDEKEQASDVNQAGEKSVVNKVKGTVSSWLGMGGDQSGTTQQPSSYSQSEVEEKERRVQQTSN